MKKVFKYGCIGCGVLFFATIILTILICILAGKSSDSYQPKGTWWEEVNINTFPYSKDVISKATQVNLPSFTIQKVHNSTYSYCLECLFTEDDMSKLSKELEQLVSNEKWILKDNWYTFSSHSSTYDFDILKYRKTEARSDFDKQFCVAFGIDLQVDSRTFYINCDESIPSLKMTTKNDLKKYFGIETPDFKILRSGGSCAAGGSYWSADTWQEIRFDKEIAVTDTLYEYYWPNADHNTRLFINKDKKTARITDDYTY